ncbi:hypothetical protein ACFRKD_05160 [Streptomyces niveus]|uniref:hypothetical protein n=1 Tax=Streptomyces niveus TaxID=193462 RepID=UPI0036AD2150
MSWTTFWPLGPARRERPVRLLQFAGGRQERSRKDWPAAREFSTAAESAALNRLLTVSGIALLCFAVLSVALAWWMPGRVLRPVGVITTTAQWLSGLAVQRAAAEIGLAVDPSPGRVAEIRTKLIQIADNSEHLIEDLLLLAASDQGLQRDEPATLDSTLSTVVATLTDEAFRAGITVHADLEPLQRRSIREAARPTARRWPGLHCGGR